MENTTSKELILSHAKGTDKAVGKLEVCALTLIYIARSKLAATVAVLVALSMGAVTASDVIELKELLFPAEISGSIDGNTID